MIARFIIAPNLYEYVITKFQKGLSGWLGLIVSRLTGPVRPPYEQPLSQRKVLCSVIVKLYKFLKNPPDYVAVFIVLTKLRICRRIKST